MPNFTALSSRHLRASPATPALAVVLLLALALGAALWAQVEGERGIAPVASSSDIAVGGIEVDVRGDDAEDARLKGWAEARRLAWEKIGGPDVADSQLQGLVSSIVIEHEQLGPKRYIARLGVIFDRQRAGGLLGAGGERTRSAPMLTLPVLKTGGTATMFEVRNEWQRAWAEYQFGSSGVDYVRPTGSGGDSLLLTYGQTSRRSRAWWSTILDDFGAADVVVPIADLRWEWPGGPVVGTFTARHGPDNLYLDSFTMRAENSEELPAMLVRAVERFDQIYNAAMASGKLRPDPTLTLDDVELSPEIRALIEAAQAAEAAAAAAAAMDPLDPNGIGTPLPPTTTFTPPVVATTSVTLSVQVSTPDARAFDAALAGLRGVSGTSGVGVASTAIGGTSVLRVTYTGSQSELAAALRSQGWQVTEGSNALAISR